MADKLLPIPLTEKTVHLCIDMQRLFSSEGPWATPWMERVLPVVVEIASRFPERTVFTRFITPRRPEDMPGMWQKYYQRWRLLVVTGEENMITDIICVPTSLAYQASPTRSKRFRSTRSTTETLQANLLAIIAE